MRREDDPMSRSTFSLGSRLGLTGSLNHQLIIVDTVGLDVQGGGEPLYRSVVNVTEEGSKPREVTLDLTQDDTLTLGLAINAHNSLDGQEGFLEEKLANMTVLPPALR